MLGKRDETMKMLVTGGAGAIGAYVVAELVSHGIDGTILDLSPPTKMVEGVDFVQCDLMDLEATIATVKGYDVVVHLAAIPHPYNDPDDRVMSVNMVTCFNVLEAVRLNGIRRIVYGCSESSTGFGIHNVELVPLYLPIDELHPCWPHETYSFTKRFGEMMVENYARAYDIEAISLRYCWVWVERDREGIQRIVDAGLRGDAAARPWFGCYVAPHDVAQAVRLSARYEFPAGQAMDFEAFYITADTIYLPIPTLQALGAHFDPMPEIRDTAYFTDKPKATLFDCRKAKRLLGFQPALDWRTFAQWPKP